MRDRISRLHSHLTRALTFRNMPLTGWLLLVVSIISLVPQIPALDAAEYDPNLLPLDDPNAVLRTVISALEGLQFPTSGRGKAIWKHRDLHAKTEGTESIVEFAFKGDSSRRDVFESRNGVKSTRLFAEIMSDKYMAVNPENAIINKADSFRRRIGNDFHPDALMKFQYRPVTEVIAALMHYSSVNPLVSLSDEGILYIRVQENPPKPNSETEADYYPEQVEIELAFDTKNGLLPISLSNIRKYPKWDVHDINRYCWTRYDSLLYPASITHVEKGVNFSYHDEFVITSFEPNVQIADKEFTLDSLSIPDGRLVFDRIAGIEYRYAIDFRQGDGDSPAIQPQQAAQIEIATSEILPSSPNSPEVESSDPTPGGRTDRRDFRRWPFACAAVILTVLGALLARRRTRRRRGS